jgi:hypothetical protein
MFEGLGEDITPEELAKLISYGQKIQRDNPELAKKIEEA